MIGKLVFRMHVAMQATQANMLQILEDYQWNFRFGLIYLVLV